MISYAQNFEDVILGRVLRDVGNHGCYIDIGAQDPVIHSVSLAFYEKGWRGIHVEPNRDFAKKLREARPDEEVLSIAVGLGEGPISFFEVADTGLSTGIEKYAREAEEAGHRVRVVSVPVLPLSRVLDNYRKRDVHWLKIDAEGMEQQIIESWEPSAVRPWVVVVESLEPVLRSTDRDELPTNYDGWEPRLLRLGYAFVYFDGLNRFYLSNEKSALQHRFSSGPCVFDDFELPLWSHHLRSVSNQIDDLRASEIHLSESLATARQNAEGLPQVVDRQSVALEQFALELQTLRESLGASQSALAAEKAARLGADAARQRASRAANDSLAAARERTRSEALARQLLVEELQTRDLLTEGHQRASEEASLRTKEVIGALHEKKRRALKASEKAVRERDALVNSTSWRVTAPLRMSGRTTRRLARLILSVGRRTRDAFMMAPGSGTRRAARKSLSALAATVKKLPVAREVARAIVRAVPPLQRAVLSASATPASRKRAAGKPKAKPHVAGHNPTRVAGAISAHLGARATREKSTMSKRSRSLYWITRGTQTHNLD